MITTVKTASGSVYTFAEKDGAIFFTRGFLLSGKVVRFHQFPRVGNELEFTYLGEGLYCELSRTESYRHSTRIVEIK